MVQSWVIIILESNDSYSMPAMKCADDEEGEQETDKVKGNVDASTLITCHWGSFEVE